MVSSFVHIHMITVDLQTTADMERDMERGMEREIRIGVAPIKLTIFRRKYITLRNDLFIDPKTYERPRHLFYN